MYFLNLPSEIVPILHVTDPEERNKQLANYATTVFPDVLPHLNKCLMDSGGEFLVGSSVR